MSEDLLFNVPESNSPDAKIAAARRRYEAALLADADADTDETGEIAKELFNARAALAEAERAAYADARGVVRRRIES